MTAAPETPETTETTVRPVEHPTPDARRAAGKAARERAPRVSHGQLELLPGRDPVALIEQENEGRVEELVPIRHFRMLASPFAFYRGTASLMARDLAATPESGLRVQLCGDAHLSNFGGFAAPDRQLVFDLNDFDETHPGPFEWDVKRLATSFEIAGRHRGLEAPVRRALAMESVAAYRGAMREFADRGNLDLWYARLNSDMLMERLRAGGSKSQAKTLARSVEKAKAKDSARALAKLTEVVDGKRRIASQPPLLVPIGELLNEEHDRNAIEEGIRNLLRLYRRTLQRDRRELLEQYRYIDMARKVVGVGSVGTRCWIVLLLGRDEDDPLVLQVKEAGPSVLEGYLGKSKFTNRGQRVVEGQRLMQAASDIFLGWIRNPEGIDGRPRDFYVRQLWDWKTSVDLETIKPEGLALYAQVCGWTLARAHARSGDRVAIASYLGKGDVFDRSVGDFATKYADLAERDYEELKTAADAGRIPIAEG
jgi:uncharacterized protein (DUF2252 family)